MSDDCHAKKFYDTEFEATVAAARASASFEANMLPYRHQRHWHIANADRELRSKKRSFNRTYCPACAQYMRPGKWESHVTRPRHQYLARKQQERAA